VNSSQGEGGRREVVVRFLLGVLVLVLMLAVNEIARELLALAYVLVNVLAALSPRL
jgi:hypothetical protein